MFFGGGSKSRTTDSSSSIPENGFPQYTLQGSALFVPLEELRILKFSQYNVLENNILVPHMS